MKNIYNTLGMTKACLCALAVSLVTTGCSDLLDKEPPSAISDGSFWTGEGDAMLALTGCYRFQTGWSHDDFATPQGLLYLDFAGGNGTEKENFSTLMASSNTVATNSNLRWYWGNAYTQIAKYNTFLENITDCPMEESKKEQWSAEVKCLRAYFFLNLAFYYKDVPMPLKTLSVDEANSISQTPQTEVYSQVEKDLKTAIDLLPVQYSSEEYGRFTRGAAKVLLSRLYLAQERWGDAATILRSVIESGIYELDRRNGEDSYEKLFQIGGEYSPEIIFCIMGIKDLYTNSRYQYLYPEAAYGGWHQFSPYNELVKEYFCADGKDIKTSEVYDENDPYVNRDLRLYASIFLPPLGSYEGTKYNDIIYAPTYTPIMRYAEVLLSYLEAVNESQPNAVDQNLLDLTINDIRDRVKLVGIKKTDVATQELVREAVRKERRVELAFEGLRYYDVLRWGIAEKELNHTFTGVKLSDDPQARNYRGSGATASPVDENMYYQFEKRTWAPHNRYFPIPQNDLNVNKNLKQNEGYN